MTTLKATSPADSRHLVSGAWQHRLHTYIKSKSICKLKWIRTAHPIQVSETALRIPGQFSAGYVNNTSQSSPAFNPLIKPEEIKIAGKLETERLAAEWIALRLQWTHALSTHPAEWETRCTGMARR
jgi:hypothetical protein